MIVGKCESWKSVFFVLDAKIDLKVQYVRVGQPVKFKFKNK